ncbi:hypothetical protein AAMO2058_001233600 [Amorphochlora amoebiformis]
MLVLLAILASVQGNEDPSRYVANWTIGSYVEKPEASMTFLRSMAAMSGAFLSQNWEAVDIPPANFATLSDGSISDDELKEVFNETLAEAFMDAFDRVGVDKTKKDGDLERGEVAKDAALTYASYLMTTNFHVIDDDGNEKITTDELEQVLTGAFVPSHHHKNRTHRINVLAGRHHTMLSTEMHQNKRTHKHKHEQIPGLTAYIQLFGGEDQKVQWNESMAAVASIYCVEAFPALDYTPQSGWGDGKLQSEEISKAFTSKIVDSIFLIFDENNDEELELGEFLDVKSDGKEFKLYTPSMVNMITVFGSKNRFIMAAGKDAELELSEAEKFFDTDMVPDFSKLDS